jgi:peptidoglycan L-alanyl-D-glutamate endopeptidase CwlK
MLKHTEPLRTLLLFLSVAAASSPVGTRTSAGRVPQTTQPAPVIVDSQMSEKEAFDGLDPACPAEIRNRQKIVEVTYYSDDGKLHRGQLVVDGELEQDIKKVFEVALRERTPIHSVVPASHPRFRRNKRWDDNLTMEANNTSAFNYRPKTGGGSLSVHAYGRAIDINPS